MTDEQKAKESRSFGRNYLVFDRDGEEYASIKGRLFHQAWDDAKECGGEVWLSGKCVLPRWNV